MTFLCTAPQAITELRVTLVRLEKFLSSEEPPLPTQAGEGERVGEEWGGALAHSLIDLWRSR